MKKIISIVFVLIICSVFVLAMSYPHAFSGSVKYNNGSSVPDGYVVTAKVGGIISGLSEIDGGTYDLVITGGSDGEEIKFYIQGEQADQTFDFERFEITELNLTIGYAPSEFGGCGDDFCDLNGGECGFCLVDCSISDCCGNGVCNSEMEETISNCPSDCEVVDDGGSPDGGSPSGGSPGGENPPSNTNTTNDTIYLNIETENDEILSIDELNEISDKKAGITGAVIGFVKSGTGMVLIFVLLIIGIGVMMVRKRASKNE